MSITQKIAAALLLMFLALLLGAALVLDQAVRPGFEGLETEAHRRNLTRVAEMLEAIGEDVRGRTVDYAMWNDTHAFVNGENPAYTADLTDDWFNDYGIDFAAFVGVDGRVLWERRRNAEGEPISDRSYAARLAEQAFPIATAQRPAAGVVYLDGSFLIVTAIPATPTNGVGEPRGLVMMGRRLSQAQLQQQTQLEIEIIDASRPPAELAEHIRALGTQDAPLSWATDDALNGLFALRDFNGRLVGAVLTGQARDITAMGARASALALALFAAICAVAVAALWFLLRAGVIRRIQRLERHFNAQTATPAPMVSEDAGADEIARLTRSYNALVMRLKDTMAREQAAELQREAEAAANRMKSAFLANISHELRTPLNAVIGYAELIKEELGEQGVTHADGDLGRIAKAARRLLFVVNEILDLSKIEVGKLEMRLETFKVEEMLQRALGGVAPLAASQGVAIELTADGDLGAAYSDEFRMRQCLINVLTSACKFAPNGNVTLHASRVLSASGERLRFVIRDSGPGLTPDQLTYAFEPFQRAGASIAATIGGASLGLAMTRKLLSLLGGHIEATSEAGEGSTFVIDTPVLAEDTPSNAPHSRAA
jgi:signal transduction histidine kinase